MDGPVPLPHLIQAHPLLLLAACAVGVLLALAYLTADLLLIPTVRLRRAARRGPDSARRIVELERERITLLEDAAAVHEEHGHPDAKALRGEAELRRVVLRRMGTRYRSGNFAG